MFDCIEKKSLFKNIEYDYVSRTTKDYYTIKNEKISKDSYKYNSNGIFPKFCCQCNEEGK